MPTGVAVTYDPTNLWNLVSWTAVGGATQYVVYWSTVPGVTTSSAQLTPTTTTSYGHSGVVAGSTYYYRVAAKNTAGQSALSSEVSVTVPTPVTIPATPTGVAVTYDPTNLWNLVSWTAVSGATQYVVYWSTVPGVTTSSAQLTPTTTTSYGHTGVVAGSTYYYRVAAKNTAGQSSLSTEVSVTVPTPVSIPATPTGVAVTYDPTNLWNLVSWTAVSGATQYVVYWSTVPGVTTSSAQLTPTTTTSYGHTGVVAGSTYYYRVAAKNSAGQSSLSTEVSVTVPTPISIPGTPTGVTVNYDATNQWDLVSWTAVSGATQYVVYWSTASGVTTSSNQLTPTTTTSYGHSGVVAGSTYYYRVAAKNTAGQSALSSEVSVTVPNNPTAPSIQLKFPILNKSCSTMTITAILDHSPHHIYPYRNQLVNSKPLYPIIDFMNERAGLTNKDWVLFKTQFGGINRAISKFLNGYTYRQTDKTLWYAGHPAYDYSWSGDVYADAPGTVFYPKTDADFGYRIHSKCVPGQYGVLGIDHRNPPFQGTGYVSFFMHLRTNPYLKANGKPIDLPEIVPEGTVITQSQVDNGLKIGIAGNIAAGQIGGTQVHLHYELHWVNSKGTHIIVDPYGWSPSDNSVDSLPLSAFNLRDGVGDDRPASDRCKDLWSGHTITSTASLAKVQKALSSNSTWQQVASPVSATFCGVCFPTSSIGYVCGNEGVILKTTDGGTTWQTAYSNPDAYISKILFTSASAGIAVGKNLILQTTDGGATWRNRWLNAAQATTWDTTNNAVFLDRISFSPNGAGFVSGCYANSQNISPLLWRSTSGGASWDYIAQFMATGNYNEKFVGGLHFVSDSIGYAGVYTRDYGVDSGGLTLDSNKVYKTYDGGNSWYESTVADDIGDIKFVSADTGYAFGYATLFKTVTGTSNQPVWYTADSFPSGINDIAITSQGLSCVGNNGTISILGNVGLWVNDSSGTTSDLNAICSQNGVTCAVGDNGTILIKEYVVDSRGNRAMLPGRTGLCSVNAKCLRYYLSAPNHVTIRIADLKGRVIETIENSPKSEGYYNVNFNLRNQSKGVYVVWINAGDYTQAEKIYLVGGNN